MNTGFVDITIFVTEGLNTPTHPTDKTVKK